MAIVYYFECLSPFNGNLKIEKRKKFLIILFNKKKNTVYKFV